MNHIDAILQMDLTQYAIKMGYNKLIKGQLTSSWISLKNESLNDTIRIKQKPFPMVYNNNDSFLSQDRGNIINFTINRLNHTVNPNPKPEKSDFAQAFKILKQELNIPIDTNLTSKLVKKTVNRSENQSVLLRINNLQDKTTEVDNYLSNKRNISIATVNHPYFSGVIKASPVVLPNKKVITNTAFIKKDLKNNIQGFTSYYYSAKSDTHEKRINSKQNLPILTNVFKETSNIYIAESPIDALSHLQMIHPKNAVYIINEGSLSPEKLEFNFNVFQQLKLNNPSINPTITSINDNDTAGFKFDIELAIQFNNKLNLNQFIETKQEHSSIKYSIHNPGDLSLDLLKDKMIKYLEDESKNKFYNNLINIGKTKSIAFIEIPVFKTNENKHLKMYLKPLSQFLFQMTKIKFQHQKSKLKDWNEDLSISKKEIIKPTKMISKTKSMKR